MAGALRQPAPVKIFRSAHAAGRATGPSVVAIGKFDGLHLGHRRLLRLALRRARLLRLPCLALSFDPLPFEYFAGEIRPPLMSVAERVAGLAALGLDGVVLLPFDRQLACLAPEAFARDVLARALRARHVFVGENFCFGRERAGNSETLGVLGALYDFSVRAVPLLRRGGAPVSSSAVRALLAAGRREQARRLLGPPLVKAMAG